MTGKKDKEKKELAHREKEPIERSAGEPTRSGIFYSPSVDIYQTDDAITLMADLPGVSRDNLDIDLKDSVLTITGSVGEDEDRPRPVYREYGIGGYMRRFTLSDKIDQGKISADLENGVLIVVLPKADSLKPRKIEIGA